MNLKLSIAFAVLVGMLLVTQTAYAQTLPAKGEPPSKNGYRAYTSYGKTGRTEFYAWGHVLLSVRKYGDISNPDKLTKAVYFVDTRDEAKRMTKLGVAAECTCGIKRPGKRVLREFEAYLNRSSWIHE